MRKCVKQFFCIHIWEDISEKPLGSYRTLPFLSVKYVTYNRVAVTKKCVKCEKTVIVERWNTVI